MFFCLVAQMLAGGSEKKKGCDLYGVRDFGGRMTIGEEEEIEECETKMSCGVVAAWNTVLGEMLDSDLRREERVWWEDEGPKM